MEELSLILNGNNGNAALKLIHWLQKHHVEIVLEKISLKTDFVREIFACFSQCPRCYEPDEWERLTTIAYIFVISIFPTPNLIPKISLTKSYGQLFSTSLLLNSWRPPDADTKMQYHKIFMKTVEYFNNGFLTSHFYSRSPIYFYHLIPTLLEKEISNPDFLPQINFFLQSIPNVKATDLNFDFVLFTSEMVKKLKGCTTLNPRELMTAFGRIFELSSASGCIFLQHFFFTWFFFIKKFSDHNPTCIESFAGEQIDTVTQLFYVTASLKHHELHRTFPWYLCFYFYDFVKNEEYQERILALICNGIRRVDRIDSVMKIPDMVNKFANSCIYNYKEENSWAMFYLLASLDSTILGLITDLKRIIGAASMNSTQNELIAMHKVSFADENTGLSPLDFELYALYPERFFTNLDDVVPVFDLMTKYCDSIRKHLSSAALFQLAFAKNIGEMLRNDIKNGLNEEFSIPLHYLADIMRSWTQLMIIVAHRQNVMNTYSQREILSYPNFPQDLTSKIKNPRRLLDFTAIFRRFFLIIEDYPHEFYSLFAMEIARQMFNAMKKGLLTYTFIEYFQFLPLVFENHSQSLFSNILSRMMEIAANNTDLFFSQSASDTTLLYSWIIFTIRFGAAPTNNKPNPLLGLFLNSYQKLFITAVLYNIKRIANQSIALRTVTLYLQQVKYHHLISGSKEEDENQKKKSKGRTKPILIEEIQESAKFEAMDTLLTLFIEEPNFLELQYLMPFLDATFQLGDRQLISKAASICIRKFRASKAQKYCRTIDPSSSTIFDSFFSMINKVDSEKGKEMLKLIPAYAPLYLQVPLKPHSAFQGITIDEYGFEMDSILAAVTNHLSDNEEIIAGLFALISCCFNIVLKNLSRPAYSYTKTMKQLIILLCHCWCHNHLHPQIEKFAYHLTCEFAKSFAKGDSNVFILCLIDVAGCSRSSMAKISLELAKTFFEYIHNNIPDFDAFFLHQTVEQFLSFFPLATRLFSILCGFSLIIRFSPDFIRIDHVRSFLVQTTEVSPLDLKFPNIVSRFLKEYLLAKQDYNEKVVFIQMIYDIICPLSMGIRNVLMKRVEKLKMPMPINSMSELESTNGSNQFLFIQRITLVFLCGLQGEFEITNSIFRKLTDFLSQRTDQSCSFEKLSRILSLILSILKNNLVFKFFSENNELSSFLHFLCNALSSRLTPLNKSAKKCFAILKDKEVNDPRFEKQLEDFYKNPDKIFKFYSPQINPERINFYVRLAKILPSKIPPHIIRSFCDAVFEYEKKKDSEKMLFVANFIKILKIFTVTEYVKSPQVSEIIHSQYTENLSYLQQYIKVIVHLYEHNEIPFITITRKYILRFLMLFSKETVHFLMHFERSIFSFFFLQDLIVMDESRTFFQTFISNFENISNSDYAKIHPAIFKLAENLSLEKKLASDPLLLRSLFMNFDNLYQIVSNPRSHHENDFSLFSNCAAAIINVFKHQISVKDVISFVKIFKLSYFARSNVSKTFLVDVFKKSSQEFLDELLDFVVANATIMEPIYIQSLLPHIIRNINKRDLSFLWSLLPRWTTECVDSRYAFLHAIVRLLGKCSPTKGALEVILEVIKTTISAADIRLLIYSLKTATCLSKKKLLPPKVFFSIFQQLFTYQKFSEPPYSKYFFAFLKSDPEQLKEISSQNFNILSYYMHNRFLHPRELQKVLSPINSVFLAAPQLYNYLPFSLITAVTTLLESRLKSPNVDDEPSEVGDLFTYAANFCQIKQPKQEELDFFIRVCFVYLQNLLSENRNSEFYEIFYNLLTTNHTDYFPIQMLNKINVIDNNTFGLVCCAANIIPVVLFDNYPMLVEKTLKFVEIESNNVNIAYLQCFMTAIFKKTTTADRFRKPIQQAFNSVKNWYSANNGDRLFVISKAIISHKASECLDYLWDFYDSLHGKTIKIDRRPLLRFLIKCLEDVFEQEKQIKTVQMIFSKVKRSANKTHVFTTSLPFIFQSTTVKNSTKQFIVENLIPLLLIDKLCNAEKMLAMLYEYSKDAAFDCKPYIIQLLLIRAHRANDSGCLLFVERVIVMLPVDFKDRISYLIMTLPIEMWEDSFIPVIISLLTPKIPIWQPLFTLAHKFGSIGGELVSVTFAKLLDESNAVQFQQFLTKLLNNPLKVKHTQIISGVLTMFHMKKVKIAYHLAEKAVKYSGNVHQLEFFLKPETDNNVPAVRYLLPHDANDIIFGIYRPYLSKSQTAAVALTFVNEYEAASQTYMNQHQQQMMLMYDEEDVNCKTLKTSSAFFEAMKKVNSHFLINTKNLHTLLTPLTTIGHANSALEWLEEAANSYQKNLDVNALEKVTASNYSKTIGKKFFSPFEKQRLCIIQAMVCVISGEPQLNSDTSCMSKAFIELYEKFKDLLNGVKTVFEATFDKDEDPVVLLMPSMKSQFSRVCGYTPQGLVAVGKSHIEDYFAKINTKVSNNTMQASDFSEFASFSFAVFCTQPSPQLNSTAFGAYCKIFMDSTIEYPVHVIHEAAARIITMCRLAFNQNDEQFLRTVRNCTTLFNIGNSEKWRFWLAHLVELAKTPWFCDMVFPMIKEMSYRSSLYAQKDNSQSLIDALNKVMNEKPSQQIPMMKICENFFNSLFDVNFEEKETQTRLVQFAVETAKLERNENAKDIVKNIHKVNLIEERKRPSIDPFHRSLKHLTLSQIELIQNFQEFANEVKNRNFDSICTYIQEITHSSQSLSEIRATISKSVHSVNENLPFIFPLRLEKPIQININQIQNDFTSLTKDVLVLKLVSNIHQWQNYIVQRSSNANGYHKSVLTLANAMFLIKQMLQKQYSARRRNLMIFPSQFFEIGANLILIPVISQPTTMEFLFQEAEMMSSREWLSKYVFEGKLTEEGKDAVERMKKDFFTEKYSNEVSAENMVKIRPVFATSTIVSCLFRHIFNAPYPNLENCVFCPSSAVVPLMHSDYDYGNITAVKKIATLSTSTLTSSTLTPSTLSSSTLSSSTLPSSTLPSSTLASSTLASSTLPSASSCRMSPNIVNVYGPTLKGKCVTTMAVMSKALTENIECVRSYIEAMIGDEDFDMNKIRSLDEIIEIRNEKEKKFLDFCPPTGPNIQQSTAVEWIEKIDQFIEMAMNPDLQPIEAIPWF